MSARSCGNQDLYIVLKVKDDQGSVSEETVEIVNITPLVCCSFVNEVPTGSDLSAKLQYNSTGSTSGATHQWDFVFQEAGQSDTPVSIGPGTGAFTAVTGALAGGGPANSYSITGTYEFPVVTVTQGTPGGVITVQDTHTVFTGTVSNACPARTRNLTMTDTNDPCDSVAIPSIDQCVTNVKAKNGSPGKVTYTWFDKKNPPGCPDITSDQITVGTITANTIQVSWEVQPFTDGWNIGWQKEGELFQTIRTVSTPNYTITDLEPNTKYSIFVRNLCSALTPALGSASDFIELQTEEQTVIVNPPQGGSAGTDVVRMGSCFVFDNNRKRLFELDLLRFYLFTTDITRSGGPSDCAFDPFDGFGGSAQDFPWGFRTLDELLQQCASTINPDGNVKRKNKMMLCTQGAADFIPRPGGVGNDRFVAKNSPGDDGTDPASYSDMAEVMFQIAVRYGNGTIPASDPRVSVRAGTTKKVNLNYIEYLQPWNEYEEWWENGGQGDWTPEEFSAYMIACYNRIKEADPNLKVAWGGFVKWSPTQWARIQAYVAANQGLITHDNSVNGGLKFPADEVCVHIYQTQIQMNTTSYRDAVDHGNIPGGIHPEKGGTVYDNMLDLVTECVTTIQGDFAQLTVSCTEAGYDKDFSPAQVQPIAGHSKFRVQADWITRMALALNAGGVNDFYHYKLDDVNAGGGGYVFGSSGLCDGDTITLASGGIQQLQTPHLAFWWLTTYGNTLANHVFTQIKNDTANNVNIYQFDYEDDNVRTFVLWSPTAEDRTLSYNFTLQGNENLPKLIEMTDGSTTGTLSTLTKATDGTVTVNISETPIFIQVIAT